MKQGGPTFGRRVFLQRLGSLATIATLQPRVMLAAEPAVITKAVPTSCERIPVIGMGSCITFDVGDDPKALATRLQVLRTFFDHGGAVIDSSPMYGSSEAVIGHCLRRIENKSSLFAATKVWIPGRWLGVKQIGRSSRLWGVDRFDLMQIHNMLDWRAHLETLKAWKAEGRLRYIGITTSHGRRHAKLERVLATEPFDFVQFTYNILDREAEQRLLPLAAERGAGVIINRPFRRGALFDLVKGRPLPDWAAEFDCRNRAQFFLKFIVSHPAVTCAIPATSRVAHMKENMGAGIGHQPDATMRQRMINYFESL